MKGLAWGLVVGGASLVVLSLLGIKADVGFAVGAFYTGLALLWGVTHRQRADDLETALNMKMLILSPGVQQGRIDYVALNVGDTLTLKLQPTHGVSSDVMIKSRSTVELEIIS